MRKWRGRNTAYSRHQGVMQQATAYESHKRYIYHPSFAFAPLGIKRSWTVPVYGYESLSSSRYLLIISWCSRSTLFQASAFASRSYSIFILIFSAFPTMPSPLPLNPSKSKGDELLRCVESAAHKPPRNLLHALSPGQ